VRRRGSARERPLAVLTVALATSAQIPDGDEDAIGLIAVLAARGIEAVSAVWDDAAIDWHEFDLVVVRSTWDYAERRGEFLRWAESLPRVANPAPILRWNTDKQQYLADLERAGVAVVPTRFIPPGAPFERPDEPFVLKPAISAGGRNSAWFDPADEGEARALVSRLHGQGRTAMIQPYLGDISETALIYVGGSCSHAVRRRVPLPRASERAVFYLEETVSPFAPSASELAIAERALAVAPGELLYGRVDLVGDSVLELEVTEPSLYLSLGRAATELFADAIARAAAANQRRRISPENGPTTSQ
jgi:glutathione synthase/RimK-type ligase-like ATP-grasp enzyme